MKRKIIKLNKIKYFGILIGVLLAQLNFGQSCLEVGSYGPGCLNNCNHDYQGVFGKLVIPLKFYKSSVNTAVDMSKIEELVDSVNRIYANNGVHIIFRTIGVEKSSPFLSTKNYCAYTGSGSCKCQNIDGVKTGGTFSEGKTLSAQNPKTLNVLVYEKIYFDTTQTTNCPPSKYQIYRGNSFYPNTDTINVNNYMVVDNDVVNKNEGYILAHELGHLLGLYHTFQRGVFGSTECDTLDGIYDTPFDEDGLDSTNTGNLMDYNNHPNATIKDLLTICQIAKIYTIIFSCRNNLCSNPSPPTLQTSTGLNVTELNYSNNSPLNVLTPQLNLKNGTNTGNYASVKIKNASGQVVYSSFTNSIDLDSIFTNPSLPKAGTYSLELRDSSVYSTCISQARLIQIRFTESTSTGPCFDIVYADYYYKCGPRNLYETTGVQYGYGGRNCTAPAGSNPVSSGGGNGSGGTGIGGGSGGGPGGPGGSGGTGGRVGASSSVPTITKNEECHECVKEIKRKVELIKIGQNGN